MKIIYYNTSQKLMLLQRYIKHLGNLLKKGLFFNLPAQKQALLIKKITRLKKQLQLVELNNTYKKVLASAAVLLAMATTNTVDAQSFKAPVKNPFGLQKAEYFVLPTAADLDGDGDYDVLISDYYGNFYYYENTGSKTLPKFGAPQKNPFGLKNQNVYYQMPKLVDIDGDGDLDVFTSAYNKVYFYENTGTATAPNFAEAIENPFSITSMADYTFIELADVDGDGDFDLFITGTDDNKIAYFENTGSKTSPAFANPTFNSFGLKTNEEDKIISVTFGDLDNDGDLDILMADETGTFYYQENIGNKNNPQFDDVQTNPFSLESFYDIGILAFVDLDSDGDLDILVGTYEFEDGNFLYYENTAGDPNSIKPIISADKITVYPNPATSELIVKVSELTGNEDIKIIVTDISGKVVLEKMQFAGAATIQLNVSNFSNGTYLLNLQQNGKIYRANFVVSK